MNISRRTFIWSLLAINLAAPIGDAQTVFGLTPAANWFVDSIAGSDSNNGTSATTPFQTIAHLQAQAILSGQCIALKCNASWREQLTISTSSISIVSYGNGANPLLDCSNIINAGVWSKTAGFSNVYQATLPVPVNTPSDPDWYTSVWQNNTRYTIGHSIASVDSIASSYYAVPVNSTTITLYVHTSDSSNPGSDGFTMEYAARLAGIMAQNTSNLTISGITARRNISANGSIIVGKDCWLNSCAANEGNKHNIFFDAGTTLSFCSTNDSYYENLGSTRYIGFGIADAARGFIFNHCTNTTTGLTDNTAPGFYIHSATLGTTFAFASFNFCTGAIAFSSCLSVTVSNSTSTRGIPAFDATSLTISNTAITYNSSDGYGISTPNTFCTVAIINGSITGYSLSGNGGSCISLQQSGSSLTINGGIYGNATNFIVSIGNAQINVNNAAVNVFNYAYYAGSATPIYVVDNNTYTNPNLNNFAFVNNISLSYAQWKATGQDTHSIP